MPLRLQVSPPVTVSLSQLGQGSPGITPSFGDALAEAAAVCLADQRHAAPASLHMDGAVACVATLSWNSPSAQAIRCWGDDHVTTEHGAYAIAALLVPVASGMQIIERARKGKGFDFWLGDNDDRGPLFQNKARLEVSGIRTGDESAVSARVRQKQTQIDKSRGRLPGIVVVVEFGRPLSRMLLR